MIELNLLDLAAGLVLHQHTALQTGVARAAVAGQYFDAIQGGHDAPLHTSWVEGFGAFETAVDIHQHVLQRVEVEAT